LNAYTILAGGWRSHVLRSLAALLDVTGSEAG
jgi:hypothetical protein